MPKHGLPAWNFAELVQSGKQIEQSDYSSVYNQTKQTFECITTLTSRAPHVRHMYRVPVTSLLPDHGWQVVVWIMRWSVRIPRAQTSE